MDPTLSPEAPSIREKLDDEGVRYLYHWTSTENLPCIEQVGALCSKQTLEDLGLWPCPAWGGRGRSHEYDRRRGNWPFIGLNFTPYTPMVYHRKREGKPLCFFIIRPEVATWQGVMFTSENAARYECRRRAGVRGLDLVNFAAVRSDPQPGNEGGWRRPVQAETLVPDRIDLDYVERVVFVSEASCAEGERLWGPSGHPSFEVAPEYFTDGYRRNSSIAFAYVDRVMLTDKDYDKDLIDRPAEHRTQFSRSSVESITGVVRVHALSGSKIFIRVEPAGIEYGPKEYAVTRSYVGQFKVPMRRLPNGENSVVYYLNDIRWAQVDFEVIG